MSSGKYSCRKETCTHEAIQQQQQQQNEFKWQDETGDMSSQKSCSGAGEMSLLCQSCFK